MNGKFVGGNNVIQNVIGKHPFLEMLPEECIKTSAIQKMMKECAKSFITVFMKGTPEDPKDEYQQILVDALKKHNFRYGYVNVVKSPDLREHIKEYTNCTSYPQVFLDKKFYSGLSEFLDLLESGKALSLIPTTEVRMEPINKFKNLLTQSRLFVFLEGAPPQGLSYTSVQKIEYSVSSKQSRELIEFLDRNHMEYKFYDVSKDKEVKKAASEYSKWTNFPQIYYD